jgi:hypothetical protein
MSVLFHTYVYEPWVDERNSGKRVTNLDHPGTQKREYILNPRFITDLVDNTLGSSFKYSDNFGDRRERWSTVICDKTVTQIKSALDSTPHSYAIKLPIYANNDGESANATTTDTTIQWSTIVFADRYNPDPENKCWVVYNKGSFKRVKVLVHLAIEDIVSLVATGTTSATFSTVAEFVV